MTSSDPIASDLDAAVSPTSTTARHGPAWYQPMVSPEHGVYVVLIISFLTGVAAAQRWTLATVLVLLSAVAGFQAEHPLVLQIRQRRSWKPRFLMWGGLYATIALGTAVYLAWRSPMLWWLYGGAIAVLILDAIAVFRRQHRSIANELLTFAAVCLTAPFAYIATTGTFTVSIVGLWLLNTFFFGSAIFTVKLRKTKTAALLPGILYHAIASLILLILCYYGWLAPVTAFAFGIALLRFCLVSGIRNWYKTAPIQYIATLETLSAILFLMITALSLLPAYLSTPM